MTNCTAHRTPRMKSSILLVSRSAAWHAKQYAMYSHCDCALESQAFNHTRFAAGNSLPVKSLTTKRSREELRGGEGVEAVVGRICSSTRKDSTVWTTSRLFPPHETLGEKHSVVGVDNCSKFQKVYLSIAKTFHPMPRRLATPSSLPSGISYIATGSPSSFPYVNQYSKASSR